MPLRFYLIYPNFSVYDPADSSTLPMLLWPQGLPFLEHPRRILPQGLCPSIPQTGMLSCSLLTVFCPGYLIENRKSSLLCRMPITPLPCSAFPFFISPTAFGLLYLFSYYLLFVVHLAPLECRSHSLGILFSFYSVMYPQNIEQCLACNRHTINRFFFRFFV